MFRYEIRDSVTGAVYEIESENEMSAGDLEDAAEEIFGVKEKRGPLASLAAYHWAGAKALGAGAQKGVRDIYAMGEKTDELKYGLAAKASKLAGSPDKEKFFRDLEEESKLRQSTLGEVAKEDFERTHRESAEEIGEFAATGLGILGGVAPAIAGTLITKNPQALIALGSSISGIQASGAKQAELAEKELERIMTQDPSINEYDARIKAINKVSGQAMLQGAKTAGVTALGGVFASKLNLAGIETGVRARSIIGSTAQTGKLGADARTLSGASNLRRLFNTSGLEGLEEGVDSALESGLDWGRGFEPDLTLKEAVDRAAESFGWGVVLGGLLGQVDKTTRFEKLGGETEAQRGERVNAERAAVLKRDMDEAGRETAERIISKVKPTISQSALAWAKAQNPTIDDVGVTQEQSDSKVMSMKLAKIEERQRIADLEQDLNLLNLENVGVDTQLQVAEEKAIRQAKEAELEAIKSGTRIEGESVGKFKPQQVFEAAIEETFTKLGVNNLEDAVKVLSGEMPARPKVEFKRTPDEVIAPQAPPIEAPVESFLDPSSIAAQENTGLPLPDHTLPHRISQLVAAMRSLRNKKDPKSMERLLVMDKQLKALRELSASQFGPRRRVGKASAQADQPLNVRDLQAARRDPDKASTVIGPTFIEKLKTKRQAKIARGIAGAQTATTAAEASPDVLAPEAPKAAEPALEGLSPSMKQILPKLMTGTTYEEQVFGLAPKAPPAPVPSKAADLEGILSGQVQPPVAPEAPVAPSKAADVGKILRGPKSRSLTVEERRLLSAHMSGKGFDQDQKAKATVQRALNKVTEALKLARGEAVVYPKKPQVHAGIVLRQSGVTPQQIIQGAIETGVLAVKAGVKAADIADIAISNLVANAKSGGIKITEHEKKQVLDKIGNFVGQTSEIPTTEIVAARAELKDMGYRKLSLDPEMAEIDIESDTIINPLEVFAESELSNKKVSEGEKRILTKARAAAKRVGLNKEGVQIDPQMATETNIAMQTVFDAIMLDRNTFDDALNVAWDSLTPVQRRMLDKDEFRAELSTKMGIVFDAIIKDDMAPVAAMSDLVSSGRAMSLASAAALNRGDLTKKQLDDIREGMDYHTMGTAPSLLQRISSWLGRSAPDEAIFRGYTLLGNKAQDQLVRMLNLDGEYEYLVFQEMEGIDITDWKGQLRQKIDAEQSAFRRERDDAYRLARKTGKEPVEGVDYQSMESLSPEAAKLVRGIDRAWEAQGQDAINAKVKQRNKDGKWVVGKFGIGKGGAYQILKKEYRGLIPMLKANSLDSDSDLKEQQQSDLKALMSALGLKPEASDMTSMMEWVNAQFPKKKDSDEDSSRKANVNSGLERARDNPLPTELIDYGLESFLAQSRGWAKRLSEIESYGQGVDGKLDLFDATVEILDDALENKYRTEFSANDVEREIKFVNDLKAHILELRDTSPWMNALSKTVSYNLLSGAASSINNMGAIGQMAATGMAMGRKRAFVKGVGRWILPSKLASILGFGDKLEAQTLRRIGVQKIILDTIASGYQTEAESGLSSAVSQLDKIGESAEKVGKFATRPFARSERAVRNLSAQMADAYLKDVQHAYKTNTDPKLVKAFKAYAKSLRGVDVDAALEGTVDGEAQFIIRVVSENVGSFKPQQMPRWMTTPFGRLIGKFFPHMAFQTQSTARMMTLLKREKGYGASFGMMMYIAASHVMTQEMLAKLKELLLGRERDVASIDEIINSPINRAVIKGGERAYQGLADAGALTMANWLIEQIRYSDGERPPSVIDTANFSIVKNAWDSATNPYLVGPTERVEDFFGKQVTAYRDAKRIGSRLAEATERYLSPEEIEAAQRALSLRNRTKMRRAIERYGKDKGIDTDRPSGVPTAMHEYYRELRDNLYIGDVLEVRKAALKAADSMENRDRAWSNVSSSILGGQPMKIGRRYSDDAQQEFIKWAENTLSPDDFRDILDAHSTYRNTALEAGLITGDEYEAERYEETRNQMKEVMNQKPAKTRGGRSSYSGPVLSKRGKRGTRSGIFVR